MQADDLRLLGIPRWRLIIAIIYSHHDALLERAALHPDRFRAPFGPPRDPCPQGQTQTN